MVGELTFKTWGLNDVCQLEDGILQINVLGKSYVYVMSFLNV